MSRRPETIDAYLASVTDVEKRAALMKLRGVIRAAVPSAEECISYAMPAFRLDGRLLVAFAAASRHCAFHAGARPIAAHRGELQGYITSKGSIRFGPEKPLPAALVRKLLKTRVAEHASRQPARRSKA